MAYLRDLFEIATLRNREYGKAEGANNEKGQLSWPFEFACRELAAQQQARPEPVA
jgi:hypothetical protein